MEQRFIQLFDVYTHGGMSRRSFLERLQVMAGAAALPGVLAVLENNYAMADTVPADDARISGSDVEIAPGIKGYLVSPNDVAAKLPAVMVIHENRGLNPHIRDVTRRVALEGFVAFGPDYLSAFGGTPADEDKARDLFSQLKPEDVVATSKAVRAALAAKGSGKVGAVGFCWGGGVVNSLAVADPDLNAGVAYYGMQPKAEDVSKIEAPLLLQYAGLDERIDAGIKNFEAALIAAGKTYEIHMYEGVNHAFNNDTNAARYDKAAADLAWGRTVEWLKKYLT